MVSNVIKKLFHLTILISGIGLLMLLFPSLVTNLYADSRLYTPSTVSPKPVAIVFGAGVWRNGSPTPVLRDRVVAAAELYFAGKTDILLMSGENRNQFHDEPTVMRNYAMGLGVPADAIVVDGDGFRTYDTCFRAHEVFGVIDAILVTQAYHLPRALYTCNNLGVSAVGIPADRRVYRRREKIYWNLRELPATLVALWEVHVSSPNLPA